MVKEASHKWRLFRILLVCAGAVILLSALNFIPAMFLKTRGMNELKGSYVKVYYEKEEAAAKDVFDLAEKHSERIANALGFEEAQNIRVFIYDRQQVFQTKKYGWISLLLDLNWYIGDNRGTDVLLTSPSCKGTPHSYEEIKQAAIHEMVHAYLSILNRRMPLWINEGMALYLANGDAPEHLYSSSRSVPSLEQTRTSNPIEFADAGGYQFSYTYFEYLDESFGWEKIITLVKTSDFQAAFGMAEEDIYNGWIEFLKQNYR